MLRTKQRSTKRLLLLMQVRLTIPTELPPVANKLPPVAPVEEKLTRSQAAIRRGQVDPEKDDLLSAIAKLGGLNKEAASSDGFDGPELETKSGIRPIFRAGKAGDTLDGMRERLSQDGYNYLDADSTGSDLQALILRALSGEVVMSPLGVQSKMAKEDQSRSEDLEAQYGPQIEQTPAPQAPVVSQDQTLTSALEEARNGNLPESEIDSILTNYPKESEAVLQLQMSMAGVEIGDSSGSNQAARVGDLRTERDNQSGSRTAPVAGQRPDEFIGQSNNGSQNGTDAMGVLLSPSMPSGNTNADSEAGSGGGINNAGLSGAVDADSPSLKPKSLRNKVSVDRTGEKRRKRITERFAKKSLKGRKDLLRQAGLMLTGDANTQGNRLVDALEGAELMATYDTLEAFTEAVSAGEISQEDVYRYANAAKRGGVINNLIRFQANANTIYSWATANNDLDIPLRSPASQKIYDDAVAQAEIDGEARRVADKDKRNTVTKFLRENRSDVESYWENSSPAERTELLNQVSANSGLDKYTPTQIKLNINKDKIEDLPNNTSQMLIRWMPDNWANFRDANNGVNTTTASDPVADTATTPVSTAPEQTEESSTTTLTEPVNGPTTEMPEDQGMKGASPKQTKDIAAAMEEHMAPVFDEEANTRVFEPPTNAEVVRLKNKVDEYVKDVGWLDVHQVNVQLSSMRRHAEHQNTPGTMAYAPDNRQKWVISLFDTSGAWSQPWVDAGYQVLRFDIQDEQLIEVQEGESVRTANIGDIFEHGIEVYANEYGAFNGEDVYAVLAACPCTDFASSGARHFAAKDADGRTLLSQEIVSQTMAIIEYLKPQVWALENPVGRIGKLTGLPQWRTSFDPYHFGDTYTKKTLLWGRHNGDMPIMPREPVEGSKMHTQYGGSCRGRNNARSVTPEGFAYAFFIANNANDNPKIDVGWKYDMLDQDNLSLAVDMEFTKADIAEQVEDAYYFDQDFDKGNRIVQSMINSHVVGKGKNTMVGLTM